MGRDRVAAVPAVDSLQYPMRLGDRRTVVALVPVDGVVVLGFFIDGEFVHLVDEPSGEA